MAEGDVSANHSVALIIRIHSEALRRFVFILVSTAVIRTLVNRSTELLALQSARNRGLPFFMATVPGEH